MKTKWLLMLVAVAMATLAIGQVKADSVFVPNHSFELLYKPGSTTITADLPGGTWTNGVGPNSALEGGGATATYSDGSTGSLVDIPGWINSPERPTAYEWDKGSGTVSKQGGQPEGGGDYTFGANGINWGVPDSGAVESDFSCGARVVSRRCSNHAQFLGNSACAQCVGRSLQDV